MRMIPTRVLTLLAVFTLLAAACGDDDVGGSQSAEQNQITTTTEAAETTTTAPPTTAAVPQDGEALVALQVSAVHFGDDGFVVIENKGDADADLNGIWLCQFPTYIDLGAVVDGAMIPAGGSVEVAAGALGGLHEEGGEAALYSAQNFSSSDAIFSFVQWGSGGARGSVAAGAGIWPGADVTVTPDPAIGAIEVFGDPADPEAWG